MAAATPLTNLHLLTSHQQPRKKRERRRNKKMKGERKDGREKGNGFAKGRGREKEGEDARERGVFSLAILCCIVLEELRLGDWRKEYCKASKRRPVMMDHFKVRVVVVLQLYLKPFPNIDSSRPVNSLLNQHLLPVYLSIDRVEVVVVNIPLRTLLGTVFLAKLVENSIQVYAFVTGCWQCGQMDHFKRDCPQLIHGSSQGSAFPAVSSPTVQQASGFKGRGARGAGGRGNGGRHDTQAGRDQAQAVGG